MNKMVLFFCVPQIAEQSNFNDVFLQNDVIRFLRKATQFVKFVNLAIFQKVCLFVVKRRLGER